ncbi:MAG: carboxypeptidase regulatory-like domain-containing protein [Planctomycetes bacterium]|nr:carboxypeptidase regulatory-like domain-containing protein [Planctomycetota bacterium]
MRKTVFALCIALVAVGCGGCGEDSEKKGSKSDEEKVASDAKPWDAAAGTATIRGKATFVGEAPTRRPLDMAVEAKCSGQHTEPVLDESAVVSPEGGLKNVFVYVKSGLDKWTFESPSDPTVIDQKGCMYTPHIQGMQPGQKLVIRNSDPLLHNIHCFAELNDGFNFGQSQQGDEQTRSFARQEVMVKFKCDVHGWMSSYIGVVRHPFFAVTAEDGTFRLPKLPAGEYEVEAWHEVFGTQRQKVTVGDGEEKEIAFSFEED